MLHGYACRNSSVGSYFNENDLRWSDFEIMSTVDLKIFFFIYGNKTLDRILNYLYNSLFKIYIDFY